MSVSSSSPQNSNITQSFQISQVTPLSLLQPTKPQRLPLEGSHLEVDGVENPKPKPESEGCFEGRLTYITVLGLDKSWEYMESNPNFFAC